MRRLLLLVLLAAPAAADERIRIAVDPRVEVLSILCRLAGNPEYNRGFKSPYLDAVDAHFAPFRDHPAVAATRDLRARYGISFNAPPSLAIQLDAGLRLAGALRPGIDPRWKDAPVAAYLDQVRDFAARGDLAGFLRAQAGYTAAVEQRFREFLADKPIVAWFDATFGRRAGASYLLVPGLLTGPMSYGVSDGGAIVEVMNLEAVDAAGLPHPGEMTHGLLAHEIAHSYVNPLVEAQSWDGFAAGYARVRDAMARQAYTTPAIVVDEAVVRAVTLLYLRDRAGAEAAKRSLAEQERLSFLWTADLADALDAVRKRHGGRIPAAELVATTRRVLAQPPSSGLR